MGRALHREASQVTQVGVTLSDPNRVPRQGHPAFEASRSSSASRSSGRLARNRDMRRVLAPLLALAALTTVAGSSSADTPTFSSPPPSPPRLEGRPIVRPAPAPRFEVVGESSAALPAFFTPQGQRFVLGQLGERYRIRIVNPTPARVEAIISVDGLDAVDGKPASLAKRGYVIPAFGDVTIDGWRTSLDTVAAFRFSSVRDSYASRTQSDRNVGVIGVAFFRENPPPPVVWRSAPRSASSPAPSAGAGGRA